MATPKRHHYLPESYLAAFTRGGSPESTFCVYDRDRNEFRPQTPKNTAVRGYYYSVETHDGQRSQRAEEVLSRVEGIAMPIIRRIDAREAITHTDKLEVSMFVALLYTRVPQFERAIREAMDGMHKALNRRIFGTVEQARSRIQRYEQETGERLNVTPEQIHEFVSGGEYSVIPDQNTIVLTMLESASEFSLRLAEMVWVIAIAPDGTSFITSDMPFVTMRPGEMEWPIRFRHNWSRYARPYHPAGLSVYWRPGGACGIQLRHQKSGSRDERRNCAEV